MTDGGKAARGAGNGLDAKCHNDHGGDQHAQRAGKAAGDHDQGEQAELGAFLFDVRHRAPIGHADGG